MWLRSAVAVLCGICVAVRLLRRAGPGDQAADGGGVAGQTVASLAQAVTNICWQITRLGWDTAEDGPKSEAGERQVALDKETVTVLRAHRRRQDAERG